MSSRVEPAGRSRRRARQERDSESGRHPQQEPEGAVLRRPEARRAERASPVRAEQGDEERLCGLEVARPRGDRCLVDDRRLCAPREADHAYRPTRRDGRPSRRRTPASASPSATLPTIPLTSGSRLTVFRRTRRRPSRLSTSPGCTGRRHLGPGHDEPQLRAPRGRDRRDPRGFRRGTIRTRLLVAKATGFRARPSAKRAWCTAGSPRGRRRTGSPGELRELVRAAEHRRRRRSGAAPRSGTPPRERRRPCWSRAPDEQRPALRPRRPTTSGEVTALTAPPSRSST